MQRGPLRMASLCELPESLSGRAHWPAGWRRGTGRYALAWQLFAGRGAVRQLAAAHEVAALRLFAGRVAALQPVAEPAVAVRRLFAEPEVAARRAPLGPGVLPERPEPPGLPLPVVPSSVPVHWRLVALTLLPARGVRSGAEILS